MMNTPNPGHAPMTSNEMAEERTEFASSRTLMAADRSLMAWVRTGLSMISFGFSIYKILEGFQHNAATAAAATGVTHSPRTVGLLLTGLGTFSIVMGTVEYWHRRRELMAWEPIKLWRPSFFMAVIMSMVGLMLFFGITSRLL